MNQQSLLLEEESYELIVYNLENEKKSYAVIGLLEEEQVVFNDGKSIKYLTLKPEESAYIEINLPDIQIVKGIRWIVIPDPMTQDIRYSKIQLTHQYYIQPTIK